MERGKALPNSDLNHIGVLLLNVTEYNQYNKTNKVEKDIKIISTVNLNIVIEFNTSCLTYTLHDNIHSKIILVLVF